MLVFIAAVRSVFSWSSRLMSSVLRSVCRAILEEMGLLQVQLTLVEIDHAALASV